MPDLSLIPQTVTILADAWRYQQTLHFIDEMAGGVVIVAIVWLVCRAVVRLFKED